MSRRRQGPSLGRVVVLVVAGLVLLLAGLVRGVQDGQDVGTGRDADPSTSSTAHPSGPAPGHRARAPRRSAAPSAAPATDPASGLRWIAADALPREARDTLRLIDRGGPYPETEDDGVFSNFEGILPDEPHGYYREYTVRTPGDPTRGARRIVAGDGHQLYWTADHYRSFARIRR